jgi:hypothetical protein
VKLSAAQLNAADALIDHLCERIDAYTTAGDPLRDKYVGFCAVTAAAHFETLVKNHVLDFCQSENRYLHAVIEEEFERFNGRIGYQDLKKLLARFDKASKDHFVAILVRHNRLASRAGKADLFPSYESLLEIRHSFSHNISATFPHISSADLRSYFAAGKRVVSALARALPP